jgi:DNA-binding GntR family transcriptional regulator
MMRAGQSRAGGVFQILKTRIRDGALAPGTRMREEDLAKMLGVSRTPVREALGKLEARGLVSLGADGLIVTELSRPQVMELYAARGILEGAAARLAAENASQSDIAAMEHLLELFSSHEGDAQTAARLNMEFHNAIYEAAHNGYIQRMLDELNDTLTLLPSTTFTVEGRPGAAIGEHRAVLSAIIARHPDDAEKAARNHIANALKARLVLMFA